jgi:radical SAM superfamily enzyme YgiQ (UPF0313 family)
MHPQQVLLVHPGTEETGQRRDFPPWGIIFVAQALARAGHSVRVVDLNGEPKLETALEQLITEFSPTVLGVTCKWGHAARRAERIFRHSAFQHPTIRRVMGGPLASTLPPDAAIATLVHAILPGDGESALLRWIDMGMPQIRDPVPAQDADLGLCSLDPHPLFDLGPYVRPPDRSDLGVPALYVSGSRGCVAKCSFCYTLAHAPAGLREGPALHLVDGLRRLHHRYGARGFYFVDDGLVSRGDWRRSFCSAVARLDEHLTWGVDLRTAEATPSILEELWNGRCRALYMGLETADDEVHRSLLRKGRTVGGAGTAINRALSMGFRVRASVVLGWPGERQADVERTLSAVEQRPALLIDAFRYNPLPNTPLAAAVAPRLGPQHIYTEYGPGAPNLSDCSDRFLDDAWERLLAIANARSGVGIPGLA